MVMNWLFPLLLLISTFESAHAVTANPLPFQESQPDGSLVTLRVWGDEKFTWNTDDDGFTVLLDEDGWYVYADKIDGALVSTGAIVGKSDPLDLGLIPHLHEDAAILELEEEEGIHHEESDGSRNLKQYVGTKGNPYILHNLVVLILFKDHAANKQRKNSLPAPATLEYLFNTPGGHKAYAKTGSMADVFLQNSYGLFTIKSTITEWIEVPFTEAYVADGRKGIGSHKMKEVVRWAMDELDRRGVLNAPDFKGKQIPGLSIAHSGYGAEFGGTDMYGAKEINRFWSQQMGMSKWTGAKSKSWASSIFISSALFGTNGNEMARIGVWAHEAFHFIGLPDLYDSDRKYNAGAGVGNWDMMGNMWGLDGTQFWPPLLCSWSKERLGWAKAVVIDKPGRYNIIQACTSNQFYKITHGFPDKEYITIENRHPCLFDVKIREMGGLLILHVDETGSVSRSTGGFMDYEKGGNPVPTKEFPKRHYMVAVMQADGRSQLEWHNGRGNFKDLFRKVADDKGVHYIGDDGIKGFDEKRRTPIDRAWPNTKSWANGVLKSTGITISEISAPGEMMSFKYSLGGSGGTGNNNNNNNNNNGVVITDSRTEANKKELSLTTIGGGKYVLAAGKPRRSTSGRSQIYNGYKLNGKSEPEGELLTIKVRSKDEGAIREGQNYKKVASGLGSILGPGQCFIARLDVLDDVNLGFASSINAISSPFGSSSTGGSRRQQKTQSGISSGDQFAIIMESGMMDLKGLLETRRFKGLEGRAMRDVASTAAQCIQAMHLSKMVWTDLKAENLVLMREDEFEPVTDGENGPVLVKGIDLESAMPFKDNPVDYSPESCPPEFAADYMKGVGAYFILEPSYDIWSLGMLLYECSTGKGYFNGKSPMQMTKALRNPNFFPRVEKVKDEKLRDLISQCLKKDPADRPSITKVLVHPYFLTTGIGPISF